MLSYSLAISFPVTFGKATETMGIANMDITNVLPIRCYVDFNHDEMMVLYTMAPTIVSTGLLLGYMFAARGSQEKRAVNDDRELSVRVTTVRGGERDITVADQLTTKAKARLKLSNNLFSGFLNINSFLLPVLTSLLFSTFPCREFDDGTSRLKIDMSIDCDGIDHKLARAYAFVMILLYIVGIPTFCFLLLFRYRLAIDPGQSELGLEEALKLRDEDTSIQFFRFLWEYYEPRCWYFETVDMLRRVFMTGGLVLCMQGSVEQISLAQIFTFIYCRILSMDKPFLKRTDVK
jgi:hypothetical protein